MEFQTFHAERIISSKKGAQTKLSMKKAAGHSIAESRKPRTRAVSPAAAPIPVAARVSAVCRGKPIQDVCYDVINTIVEVPKGVPLGISVKKDIVVSILHGSPAQGFLCCGDILLSINGNTVTDDQNKTKDLITKLLPSLKLTIQAVRMKCRSSNKAIVAEGYQTQDGFDYEWAVMYPIRGLSLGLDIKEIEGKVYVANLLPESLGSMSLCVGECIIDIGSPKPELITNVSQVTRLIAGSLEQKGAVRICVEVPVWDVHKNAVRAKIQKAMVPCEPKDYPLPPDAMKYAEKGIATLKDCAEPKSIYIEPTAKSPNPKHKISFNEKANEQGVPIEMHSRLLVPVPPAKTLESEMAMKQLTTASVQTTSSRE